MKYKILFVCLNILSIGCSKEPTPEISPLESAKEVLGEKEFDFTDFLYPKLEVNSLNEYLISGVISTNVYSKWGGFFLSLNDSLKKEYSMLPPDLNFNGNLIGGELYTKIVEDNNILVFGTLNNSKCIIGKYSSRGEKMWLNVLSGEHSSLQIRNVINVRNDYYFIGSEYATWSRGAASLITKIGKISKDGDVIFSKTLENFSLGYEIQPFNDHSFLISSAQFYYKDQQTFGMPYDKVYPIILNVDFTGNIIWQTKIDELATIRFHPGLFYIEKGTDGIYCTYRKGSYANESKLTKVNFDGYVEWRRNIDNINIFPPYYTFTSISDITIDINNNIYLAGDAVDDYNFGFTYLGVAKYDSQGNYLKAYTNVDSDNRLSAFGIKMDNHGNLVVACENYDENNITVFKLNKNLELL